MSIKLAVVFTFGQKVTSEPNLETMPAYPRKTSESPNSSEASRTIRFKEKQDYPINL